MSGLYLIIESWLNEFADNENRGLVMSAYIIVNYAAFTVGQLMVTLAQPESFYLFAIASIIISVAVMPVAMTKGCATGTDRYRQAGSAPRVQNIAGRHYLGLSDWRGAWLAPDLCPDLCG